MNRQHRRRLRIFGPLVLLAALCACGTDHPTAHPPEESSMTVGYGQGPMEQAVVRMMHMRTEMIGALDDELGAETWRPLANEDGVTGALCNDGVSSTLALRIYSFAGTYPAARWQDAARIVEKIGRRYGFDEIEHTVDRPGNLSMTGLAPDGGSYTFTMADATVLTIRTGCYRWSRTPGPEDWQRIDPTP